MATYIRRGRMNIEEIIPLSVIGGTTIYDDPYNTQVFYLNGALGTKGKYVPSGGGTQMSRNRSGYSYSIPIGTAEPAAAEIQLHLDTFINTLESFSPAIYISNTDDHLYPNGWEVNLDIGPYLAVYGDTTEQRISIDPSLIPLHAGDYLSITLGNNLELTNSGVAVGGASQEASFRNLFNPKLILTY